MMLELTHVTVLETEANYRPINKNIKPDLVSNHDRRCGTQAS